MLVADGLDRSATGREEPQSPPLALSSRPVDSRAQLEKSALDRSGRADPDKSSGKCPIRRRREVQLLLQVVLLPLIFGGES